MIRKKKNREEIVIDLTGPDGNAFALMGNAIRLAKMLGYSEEKKDKLMEDMQSGDYENLIQVFEDHFGDFVILER
jgi:hypothetical protein